MDYLALLLVLVFFITHLVLRRVRGLFLGITPNKPVYENYLFWWFLGIPMVTGIVLMGVPDSNIVSLVNSLLLSSYTGNQIGLMFCGAAIPSAVIFLKLHVNAIASLKFDSDIKKDSNSDFETYFAGVEKRFELLQITSYPKLKSFLYTIKDRQEVWCNPPAIKCDACREFVYENTNFWSVVKQLHFINDLKEDVEDENFGKRVKCYFAQLRGMLMVSGIDAVEFRARLAGMTEDKFRIVVSNQEDWRKFNVDFAFLIREAILYFDLQNIKLVELYDSKNNASLPIIREKGNSLIVRLPFKPKLKFQIFRYFEPYTKKIG